MRQAVYFLLAFCILFSTAACGGSPASEETPAPDASSDCAITYQNVIVYTNGAGETCVQTIIEFTNNGSEPLYIPAGSYDLTDAAGNLIAKRADVSEYPNIIQAGEKGYMYDETVLETAAGKTDLTVVPHISAKPAKADPIRDKVFDIQFADNKAGGITAQGQVENTSADPQSSIYINIVLFDADKKPIGLIHTLLISPLNAGDQCEFEASSLMLPDSVKAASIASYSTYAYPLQMQS